MMKAHHQTTTAARPRLVAGSVLALCGLLSAACGSSPTSGSHSGSSGGSKTIKVGLSLPFSGPASVYGTVAKGAIAFFKNANTAGGVNGYKFSWVQQDNAYSAAQSVAVATKFVQTDNVNAIITAGTPPTSGLFSVAKSLGVPILAAAGGNYFSPPPAPNMFSQNPPYDAESEYLARFAMTSLKAKNLALIYEDDDVGLPSSKVLPKYVPSNGGHLTASIPVSNTTTDLSPFAARLKSSHADAVVAFLGTSLMADLQKACAQIGYQPKWLTFFAAFDPSYFQLAGQLSNGVYADNYMIPLSVGGNNVSEYTKAMKAEDPAEVQSVFAEQGWNFAAMLADAVRAVVSAGKAPTSANLVAAISRESGPIGLMYSVNFTANSHTATHGSAMFQFDANGGAKEVSPYTNYPTGG